MSRKYRVIQWGTGSVGRTALRRIIDGPAYELAGVYVTSEAKHGVDAGDLVKRPRTGIYATRDLGEILATDADIVLHTALLSVPYEAQNEAVAEVLASGKNLISTNGFYRPRVHAENYWRPLENAALTGGVTLAGAGLNPGFVAERLALLGTGLLADLAEVRCYETFDASRSPSRRLLEAVMGFGTDPDETSLTTSPLADVYNAYYAETLQFVAEALNTTVESITPQHEVTLAPHDIELPAMTIRRGHVAATTWRWRGEFASGASMLHEILWTSSVDLHPQLADGGGHWRVEIDGRPNVRMSLDLSDSDPAIPSSRPAMDATASVLLGLIPGVVDAEPGFFDLPVLAPFRAAETIRR
ncbi:hypothetical protein [Gordonia terrae]|uniref:Dihydrodipicolinate reductase n=2 Tax=Gordonia terrae TaxID=2055 RepID=A0AAD0P0X6_9ACTN|nr:hypothetical protein [Gordonia terrae]VTR08064.1 dihydrodipicolinate reductase [Clostridioides difficile]ANY25198.1 hypothetical protein BCM27_22385 [Gordonia terrae]AWO85944.1 hypothetical protein DLJ61_22615 [Gordonia terrae]VTS62136.1 Uncharacterized conserved protein related to dihydrodipicolinate reductase [Gordonia terrae]GAB45535.1 hypothetical protein GOTRE_125_01720 [Gordonia terrae NBRC 100016]